MHDNGHRCLSYVMMYPIAIAGYTDDVYITIAIGGYVTYTHVFHKKIRIVMYLIIDSIVMYLIMAIGGYVMLCGR